MRVTSESLCLRIALPREGEEEHACDLACTSVGQPVLETNSLFSYDKMSAVVRTRTNSPVMEVWKYQHCYISCEFKQ